MNTFLYFEVDIICVLVLFSIVRVMKQQVGSNLKDELLCFLILSSITVNLSDAAWVLIDGRSFLFSSQINLLLNLIYAYMSTVAGFLWLLYVDLKLFDNINALQKRLIAYALPMLAVFVIATASLWNKCMFYVDDTFHYRHGKYFYVAYAVVFVYIMTATIIALIRTAKSKSEYKRIEYSSLTKFASLPILCGVFAVIFPSRMSLVWPAVTISLLNIYVNSQKMQISQDGLTGTNNRRQLNKYLDMKIAERRIGTNLYIIMIDLDLFKQINDKFGHVEGDSALLNVTAILKKVCGKYNCFLARYGGDEFSIVIESQSPDVIDSIKNDINYEVDAFNEKGQSKYKLSLSLGVAKYSPGLHHVQDQFIAAADKELYKIKVEKKTARQ